MKKFSLLPHYIKDFPFFFLDGDDLAVDRDSRLITHS